MSDASTGALSRRKALLLAGATVVPGMATAADDWPSKPVRLVVPFPPGGPSGVLARVVAEALAIPLGRQIVIDNRGGAGGSIGAETAARSAPDGYTILFATAGTHGISPALFPRLPYDPVRDFSPVGLVASAANVFIVNPSFEARTLAELIAIAKRAPGSLSYASAGGGTTPHMTMELLKSIAGLDIVHVPYRGGGPAMSDLIAGHVKIMVDGLPTGLQQIRAGTVRSLAVSSLERSRFAPEIPAASETVPGFDAQTWWGLAAPAGTPDAIVMKLNAALNTALASDVLRTKLAEFAAEPIGGSPKQMENAVAADIQKWAEVVRLTGARAD
jgi:tripartite-type tricarboxylate transporter receptor subunit TctC